MPVLREAQIVMGCDIHAAIEYHIAEYSDDHWDTFALLGSEPRWYNLFGALTNGEVRGWEPGGHPEIAPRGFPSDAGWETQSQFESEGRDAHTPSWVTPEEFAQALAACEEEEYYWSTVLATMQKLAEKWPTRLVFWFDN
jgi:hypothetical protein